ncbi:MAG: GIY-YIG nuclease family protein [Rhodoferax sp.]
MNTPFSITLFSTTGDPNGIRHIDKSNWSGFGVVFAKNQLADLKSHPSFGQAGIYILVGNAAEETIYIGEADPVGDRLRNHKANKEGWGWGVYFVDTNHKIGKTEVQYLEYALIQRANKCDRAILLNKNNVTMPSMSPVAKATAHQFFCDMLLILPMLGISAFTLPTEAAPTDEVLHSVSAHDIELFDTIVVPARQEGFKARFINEHCWFAIRIQAKHIGKLKYIAAYQVAPVGAITHLAEIDKIEPYGDSGKYMLRFKAAAIAITPIARGADSSITLQGPRYALRSKLLAAKWLDQVWH